MSSGPAPADDDSEIDAPLADYCAYVTRYPPINEDSPWASPLQHFRGRL